MLVKYGESVTPLRKEQSGVTFFTGTRTPSAAIGQKNDRWRYPRQNHSRWPLIHLARIWRTLSATNKNNWNLWAQTYPQPAEFPASGFLNGYQAFLRRNYWILFADGFNSDLMLEPELSEIVDTDLTLQLVSVPGNLTLNYDYGRNDSKIVSFVFISIPVSHGRSYSRSVFRFMCKIVNSGGIVIKYGNLFNWFCVADSRNIAPVGFHVPSLAEINTRITYIGGSSVAGGKSKITGTEFWNYPNTGATNDFGLSAKGCGSRRNLFQDFKSFCQYWSSTKVTSNLSWFSGMSFNSSAENNAIGYDHWGQPLNYIKDDSTEVPTVTGNDGKIYDCVKIGTQVWTVGPSAETKFRNGDTIPKVTDQTTWNNLTTAAMCFYNNDQANSFTAGTNSIDITDMFYNMFGLLPMAGQKVLVKVLSFAKNSGQKISESTSYLYVQ